MIKLIDYKRDKESLQCYFEHSQWVNFYNFGKSIYSEVSDGIGKSGIKKLKERINKDGLDADLDEFIGQYFKQYFEV